MKLLSTVKGRIVNCPSCRKHKHAYILGDPRCGGQCESKHVTPLKFRQHSEEFDISWVQKTAVRALEHMKRTEIKDSKWALHRRKTNMYSCFQASMFETDHQIKTFCVFTQHSTVQWHTVPWLHNTVLYNDTLFHDYTTPPFSMWQNYVHIHTEVNPPKQSNRYSCSCVRHEDIQHKHSYSCTDL
jgi:hypothetical protein